MNEIKCMIVDDESIARRIITGYLNDLSRFKIVATCNNAMEALQVLEKESIDLMFLDIEMPKLKGLDFLKTLTSPPAVIVTTAHREYALEGYDHEILDYLLKPFSFDRFIKAVNRFKKERSKEPANTVSKIHEPPNLIYVKSERKTVKIKKSDILYIEGMSNYVVLFENNNKHIVYKSLTAFLEELGEDFARVHKSYVVNKNQISSFNKEEIFITDISIPIGKTYKHVISEL